MKNTGNESRESSNLSMVDIKEGSHGIVLSVNGGRGVTQRLEALGIRPGQSFLKVSGSFLKGPVTVQVGRSRLAIGHGMASKVLVRVQGES